MSQVTKMLPAILPEVTITAKAPNGQRETIFSLCQAGGIECKVTGPAALRHIHLLAGQLAVAREPGSLGLVAITIPEEDPKRRAILALGILAYAVFDYAARESLRGNPEAAFALPLGRPRKARPLNGAERQRLWRTRHGIHSSLPSP